MDIKSSPDSYHTASGISRSDLEAVKESVLWLKHGTLPYEFRTTAVKGLHHRNDFEQIGHWIDGCSHYYLQNYTASDRVLHPYGFDSFSREELLEFADIVRPYAGKVSLRGVDY